MGLFQVLQISSHMYVVIMRCVCAWVRVCVCVCGVCIIYLCVYIQNITEHTYITFPGVNIMHINKKF